MATKTFQFFIMSQDDEKKLVEELEKLQEKLNILFKEIEVEDKTKVKEIPRLQREY